MANELRVRQNSIGGMIEDNPLTSSATTLTSASLAAVRAVTATQHFAIILDPDGVSGEPEIAHISAHTASATTATIIRGREGTVARQHSRDTYWVHGPTMYDIEGDPAWITPTYTNGWVDYGLGYGGAGYRKDPGGWVHLRGLIKNGTLNQGAFTLPVGYRPAFISLHAVQTNPNTIGRVDIQVTGEVTISASNSNSWVSLNGIVFYGDQ